NGAPNAKVFLRTLGDTTANNPAVYDIDWGAGLSNVDLSDINLFTDSLTFPANVTNFSAFDVFVQDGFGNEMQRIAQSGAGLFGLSFGGVNSTTQVPTGNPSAPQLQTYLTTTISNAS